MASVSLAIDHIIQKTYRSFPHLPPYRCLANGLDVSLYQFRAAPSPCLAWVGRIAPEKA